MAKNDLGQELHRERQKIIAKGYILIDRCPKKKEKLLSLWYKNKWHKVIKLIDNKYKGKKDKNIKDLREYASYLMDLDGYSLYLKYAFEPIYTE